VVYEDEHLIVVDKPAGVVVHPGAGVREHTLVAGLLGRYPDLAELAVPAGDDRLGLVHRLDKGTSGLLVVARTADAYQSLTSQLLARTISRRYRAVVRGLVAADEGVIDAAIGRSLRNRTRMAVSAGASAREARTHYRVERRWRDPIEASELEVSLETGRTHQIRVHLSAIGHPVLGDVPYGDRHPGPSAGRPFLHAWRLGLEHPATGEAMTFTAELPADLLEVLAQLRQ
jgi:23S rRNA pseudouridine1911/1915/1917 synthase